MDKALSLIVKEKANYIKNMLSANEIIVTYTFMANHG